MFMCLFFFLFSIRNHPLAVQIQICLISRILESMMKWINLLDLRSMVSEPLFVGAFSSKHSSRKLKFCTDSKCYANKNCRKYAKVWDNCVNMSFLCVVMYLSIRWVDIRQTLGRFHPTGTVSSYPLNQDQHGQLHLPQSLRKRQFWQGTEQWRQCETNCETAVLKTREKKREYK